MATRTDSTEIQNVVASTGIDHELELKELAADMTGVEYNPSGVPGLVYRIQEPKATVLIFRSGKIVCTGASSTENVDEAMSIVFRELRNLGLRLDKSPEITLHNIVSKADLGESLNLNAIAIGLELENVEYEPEQFPGLLYQMSEPDVAIILFGSGKVIIAGAKRPTDAKTAVDHLIRQLDDLGLIDT